MTKDFWNESNHIICAKQELEQTSKAAEKLFMTTKPKHTALPWIVQNDYICTHKAEVASDIVCLAPERDGYLTPWEANATFIVRACNSHEKLLGTLKYAYELLKLYGVYDTPQGAFSKEMLLQAIAEAEKE